LESDDNFGRKRPSLFLVWNPYNALNEGLRTFV